jgi:hypothetical protein
MGAVAQPISSFMGHLFSTPKPPEAPPAPTTSMAGVQAAAASTAKARSRARGYRSTILSQQFMAPAQAQPLKDTLGA